MDNAEFTGSGTLIPLVTDLSGRVILGFDSAIKSLVGAFSGGGGGSGPLAIIRTPKVTIPAGDLPMSAQIQHSLSYGQSLSIGAQGQPAKSTTQPYLNISFANGPRSTNRVGTLGGLDAFAPLIENNVSGEGGTNRGETCCSADANYGTELAAIENGIDYATAGTVTLASCAGHGSYTIAMLQPGHVEGGYEWYQNFQDHVQAGFDLATDAGKSYCINAFTWIQGEWDARDRQSQAYYLGAMASLRASMQADYQSITGNTNRPAWLMYQTIYMIAERTPDIALAQLAYAMDPDNHAYIVSPIYHMPFADDHLHMTSVGYIWLGHYIARARKAIEVDKCKPQFVKPISATARGQVVRVEFDVPVQPLVIDSTTLAPTQDQGFVVTDTSGSLTIGSVTVVDGNAVLLSIDRALNGDAVVRYALDHLGVGLTPTGGASGNLRDSEPSSFKLDGGTYPLYNVAPHFQLSIIQLGA